MISKAPLLSIYPSGSFMKVLTVLRHQKFGVVQGYHFPTGTASVSQLFQRARFSLAKQLWNDFAVLEKDFFDNTARLKRYLNYNALTSFFLMNYPAEHFEYGANDFGYSLYGA